MSGAATTPLPAISLIRYLGSNRLAVVDTVGGTYTLHFDSLTISTETPSFSDSVAWLRS